MTHQHTDRSHVSVMKTEVLDALVVNTNKSYLDATFGRGGHTEALLQAGARVIALDWDPAAITFGQNKFDQHIKSGQLVLKQGHFANLEQLVTPELPNQASLGGVLFDFGTSTEQLTSDDRGFSVHGDGYLDMRMDQHLGVTAADLLAVGSQKELTRLFSEYGGEEYAHAIARAIKSHPIPITTAQQLSELITQVKRHHTSRQGQSSLHPATKVFQALRIAVNSELEEITAALPAALALLEPEGRIVTIAFHEGEDRIPKQFFTAWQNQGKGTALLKKPLTPSAQEVAENPRSRSAKLRIFEKNTTKKMN